ncbi:MBL fold metallo-hydrolase [Stenotrophobium rhamnosiphilum]|uniref:Zn-dependent hydrolase n=1 Tax=Stenotrophobium rhamnosiphilum TaxID=2029166 RepID=A0A2T5MCR5_9GAMM|nr:MBL fold metallo-hydrolase [Stenotrophobium rhamnosiphilum]PTU30372.1 Zn-dependent hydrolase [Stenotrophobium rhamnosiphilum]
MIFRQLFDQTSSTYTYLLASRTGGEALLIDPVKENTDQYLKLVEELGLRLVIALDTHTHADHVTALGSLRDATACATLMGEQSRAECVTARFHDGERLRVDGLVLQALYTPGHTDESYSLAMDDRVFTGDVLLIRGTGRTDFQNGSAQDSWSSIVNTLFRLPDETLVYPAHDYRGWTASSIGEEKRWNPRLHGKTAAEYVEIMNNLDLPDPKMMDVAVPANLHCGNSV